MAKNTKPRIALIVGTRPEAIKLAPVYHALQPTLGENAQWVSTGQHSEMLHQAQSMFKIDAHTDLDLMRPGQQAIDVVAAASTKLSELWRDDRPDMVVVQGDTSTAYAAALAAFYLKIPVAHVEAGLRSGTLAEPFPEEMHRRMIAVATTLHFAPTEHAAYCLIKEGIDEHAIHMVGNTVIDAHKSVPIESPPSMAGVSNKQRWVLVTAHRSENHGKRLNEICHALLDIRDQVKDVSILFPVHMNPKVQQTVHDVLQDKERIHLVPPLDYFEFINTMRNSYIILTDSGGIQEEAPSLRVPVLVMRNQTERPEAIEAGMNKLVGSNRKQIAEEAVALLLSKELHRSMRVGTPPYGDGHSGERIANIMLEYLGAGTEE
ncbi:MAG: UDP-N-acetylglucosamine 2-epimerase (non-hydrolyzing) [Rickettsiales bacterium]|nr:UDP-N-acetylglucosamine 2-epimerase (non-hydrolyzing) [Rickettsiales bacterium]